MAQIVNHKIDGQPFTPIREAKGLTISALFGLDVQPVLNITTGSFTNTEESFSSSVIRQLQEDNPVEAADYSFEVVDGSDAYSFDFYFDYAQLRKISDVETHIGLVKDRALNSLLDFEGADVTMASLELQGVLTIADYTNIPYVVHNRKTLLEKGQLLFQFYTILKTAADEVFKLINISADITTLGVVQAALNLTTTLISLVALIQSLTDFVTQTRNDFFPPILYHSGIKLKTFLEKAIEYLGYDVEFGTVWEELDDIVLCPSKNDEVGTPVALPVTPLIGILKPGDFGYNLAEGFELARRLANVDIAVIDTTVHIRPKKDPFWILNSGYTLPSVKIEESPFTNNGTSRYNYDELRAATTIEYATDDSDYWTIQELVDGDASGDRISVTTVTPITVGDQRKVQIKGIRKIEIPYALCVRKNTVDDLIDFMVDVVGGFDQMKDIIKDKFDSLSSFFSDTFPALDALGSFGFNRDGALKVENDFFSTPKLIYLKDNGNNDGRIPADFNDKVGARAIYQKYYTYDSLVPGIRNPSVPNDTNGKEIFEGVKIPFTIKDFNTIINNSYFSTEEGGFGKFIKCDWDVDGDFATVDFWIQKNWVKNAKEQQA